MEILNCESKQYKAWVVVGASLWSLRRLASRYARANGLKLPKVKTLESSAVSFIDFGKISFDYYHHTDRLLITIEK